MGLAFRFALIGLFLAGVAALNLRHPEALERPEAVVGVALLGLLLFASLFEERRAQALAREAARRPISGEARRRKADLMRRGGVALRTAAVNLAIWCAIVAGFAVAYAHREDIREKALSAYSALQPGVPVALSAVEAVLTRDGGHFTTVAQVNGETVRMLVDTGSTDVALPYEEAARLGVDVAALQFTRAVMTANGQAMVAPVVLPTVTVGPITLRDVPASVAEPGRLGSPLLGMSFLSELSEVVIRGDKLRLKS